MSDLKNLEKAMNNARESARLAMNSLYDLSAFDLKIGFSTPNIERVIFNDPATIVFWVDGTKTVVKCQPDDTYDKEKGLALCISKKYFGNKGNFNEVFKKFVPDEPKQEESKPVEKSIEMMREQLKGQCRGKNCIECRLRDDPCKCGRGHWFDEYSGDEIKRLYKKVFEKED